MILQALTHYYQTLEKKEKVPKIGWCEAKVSFCLEIREDGTLRTIVPLKEEETRGKKKVWVPKLLKVPEMITRSSGIASNFLCDNSKYFLGIDENGTEGRVKDCFDAAKKKHLECLEGIETPSAKAVKAFFANWEPERAREIPEISEMWEEITAGGNFVFSVSTLSKEGKYVHEEPEIIRAWDEFYLSVKGKTQGICLVTGEKTDISRIHTLIKGVRGAQSSGAALVSFNAPAFESYGKEQGYNAPIGKYAAFAYTTALNYLLSQEKYVLQLGDTTVACWAEEGEEEYQELWEMVCQPKEDNQDTVRSIFQNLKEHRPVIINEIELDMEQKFYVLGISPNAARLSVSFFYENSMGNILTNLSKNYERLEIVRPSWDQREYIGVWGMLMETVNPNTREKKPIHNMSDMLMRAILSDERYPESLYTNTLIRIRAEQGGVTRGRAANIKAYLLKNKQMEKEEITVGLDETRNDPPYVLGRDFAVLEMIQKETNPGINTTIKDRFFNAASATPNVIFPVILRLANSHLRKFEKSQEGKKIYYQNLLTDLQGRLADYPKRLTLPEQGLFILGYYHQVQKFYEKKEK